MSTTKLLPCPFCGNTDITINNENPKDSSGGYFIACAGCGASTNLRFACGDDPIPLLAEQWNRRATVAVPDGRKLVPVQVPDSAFPWVSGGYSTDYRAHDPRDQKIIEDRAQRTWEAILDGIAAAPASAPDMVSVNKEDANNYCRILAVLGMEEEGDPVTEVQNLLAASVAQDAVMQAVRNYYFALDTRQHGGVAASTALDAIQKALGLNWVQGAEASARAAAEGK